MFHLACRTNSHRATFLLNLIEEQRKGVSEVTVWNKTLAESIMFHKLILIWSH